MTNRNTRLLCCIAAGLCTGGIVHAQQTFGTFKGRVTDKATGAPKAGVVITIDNQATGYHRQSVSNSDGTFRFSVVPLGNYRILFKSNDSTASMIRTASLGSETDASVGMAPAATATVTVVATADTVDQVNTTSAEVGVNVSSERLESLPVLSRNVVSAAVLAPGVQLIGGSNVDPTKKSSTYMSTGEGQGRGTNFNIDGGDNNSSDVGGYVSPIPMDAIGEFQVVTNQYKAEFGRSNAGFLNVVSKAGANAFSGIVSGQFTNQALRARSTDEGDKQDNNSRTLAALVSGPIIKDKLFYMVSVERKDEESAAYTFSDQAKAAYPTLGSLKTELKETIAYLRFDWAASQMVNVTATYSYNKNETPNQSFPHTGLAMGNVDPSMLGTGLNKTNRFGLKATTMFTPNVIWESNLIYFDYANGITPNGAGDGGNSNLQLRTRTSTNNSIPTSLRGRLGHDPNAFQNTGIKRLQWRNDFTYMAGDHFLKGGLDYQSSEYADQNLFFPETGVYQIFLAGLVGTNPLPFGPALWGNTIQANTNVIGIGIVPDGFQKGDKYKQYGLYLQDDWTVNSNFSVYLGVRFDKDTVFDFMKDYQGLYDQIYATSPGFLRGKSVPKNKTYVSPRLQIVYKPKGDDSVTFKVGYGKFVANTIDNVTGFSRALGNKANGIDGNFIGNSAALGVVGGAGGIFPADYRVANFTAGTTITTVNGNPVVLPADLTPYNYVNNVGGLRDYFRNTVNGWLTTANFGTAGKNLLASDFQYPTTDTFNLGGTFKLSDRQSLDLQYIWSRTQHATVQFAADGSDPLATSTGPGTLGNMGDNLFVSNQTARSHQLQVKYNYSGPNFSALFNIVVKDMRSTYGGSAGSFDAKGAADFYGGGTDIPYLTGEERRSAGSEFLSGSFALNYRFDFGTKIGVLGTWHSGKFYDQYLGYNTYFAELDNGDGVIHLGESDLAHPNDRLGQGTGDWNLDIGLRISHTFTFGKKMTIEPFLQISNILNNYDYGANYDGVANNIGSVMVDDGSGIPANFIEVPVPIRNSEFNKRGHNWQANQPRTAAFGFRFTF